MTLKECAPILSFSRGSLILNGPVCPRHGLESRHGGVEHQPAGLECKCGGLAGRDGLVGRDGLARHRGTA